MVYKVLNRRFRRFFHKADGHRDGRTNPSIEMRGRIQIEEGKKEKAWRQKIKYEGEIREGIKAHKQTPVITK